MDLLRSWLEVLVSRVLAHCQQFGLIAFLWYNVHYHPGDINANVET